VAYCSIIKSNPVSFSTFLSGAEHSLRMDQGELLSPKSD